MYNIMSGNFLQPVDFQVVVVSDNSTGKTYAIFTYNCTSFDEERYRNFPDELSATIGVKIPGIPPETFRYSDTPYAVELRCVNIPEDETFVNLVYDLNPSVNETLSPGETDNPYSKHTLYIDHTVALFPDVITSSTTVAIMPVSVQHTHFSDNLFMCVGVHAPVCVCVCSSR